MRRKVADILVNFGVPRDRITVRWEDAPQNNHGVLDWRKRRVTVVVTPSQKVPMNSRAFALAAVLLPGACRDDAGRLSAAHLRR